jgi:hypothetical protein
LVLAKSIQRDVRSSGTSRRDDVVHTSQLHPGAVPVPPQIGLPHNLDDVPRSATFDAAIASITKAWDGSQQGVANLNYRLERLSDIADCTQGQIEHSGFVDVLIHFSAAAEGAEATAENVEFKAVHLAADERETAVKCIAHALIGSRNVVADARFAGTSRVAPMRIRFPVEDSAIYSFLETGDMKFYGNDYDGRR